ncbi:MAG: hypothetical protein F6K10_41785, partial [Moorea sp. SIO2B7]|nr:hypothetical protein [Moorena sp. SIO2B7]
MNSEFLAVAKLGKASWWRYLLVTLLVVAGYIVGELVRGGFAYFLDKINGKPNTYINPDLGEFIYQYSDDLPFVF